MAFSFEGVRMHVTQTDPNGVVNADTYFDFSQHEDVVEARYAGGGVQVGYLVGVLNDHTLTFRYAQLDQSGQLDGGASTGEVQRLPDGRLQLIEHFEWASRDGVGTNVFEEIRES